MSETEKQGMWVLRSVPYKEYSQLVDLFTENCGRVTAVIHGSRKPKSPLKSLLQPFNYISAVLSRKNSDLFSLKDIELKNSIVLKPKELICAQYLNEIIFYLLEKNIPEPKIFGNYYRALKELGSGGQTNIEALLRSFELDLLDNLGYGINFVNDYQGTIIRSNVNYVYELDSGFIPISFDSDNKNVFLGACLASIYRRDFRDRNVLQATKYICKMVINSKLGNNKIYTRALFAQYLSMRR